MPTVLDDVSFDLHAAKSSGWPDWSVRGVRNWPARSSAQTDEIAVKRLEGETVQVDSPQDALRSALAWYQRIARNKD